MYLEMYDQYPLSSVKLRGNRQTTSQTCRRPRVKDVIPRAISLSLKITSGEKQWGYLASITFADAQLGRLLDTGKSDYADITIIVPSKRSWLGKKNIGANCPLPGGLAVPLIVCPVVTKDSSLRTHCKSPGCYRSGSVIGKLTCKRTGKTNIDPLLKKPPSPEHHITTRG